MTRVLVVDDHPAVRTGLSTVLDAAPGIHPVGAVSGGDELWPAVQRKRPDVVLMDYHLPGEDGLLLCHRLKHTVLPPGVLLYTAYASPQLVVPALVAGADGIVAKNAPARELLLALRTVADGGTVLPELQPDIFSEAASRLSDDDRPVMSMLTRRIPMGEIADTLRQPVDVVADQVRRIIRALRVETPARTQL